MLTIGSLSTGQPGIFNQADLIPKFRDSELRNDKIISIKVYSPFKERKLKYNQTDLGFAIFADMGVGVKGDYWILQKAVLSLVAVGFLAGNC